MAQNSASVGDRRWNSSGARLDVFKATTPCSRAASYQRVGTIYRISRQDSTSSPMIRVPVSFDMLVTSQRPTWRHITETSTFRIHVTNKKLIFLEWLVGTHYFLISFSFILLPHTLHLLLHHNGFLIKNYLLSLLHFAFSFCRPLPFLFCSPSSISLFIIPNSSYSVFWHSRLWFQCHQSRFLYLKCDKIAFKIITIMINTVRPIYTTKLGPWSLYCLM